MLANIKRALAVGTVLAGLGWVTAMSAEAADAQPPPVPQGNTFTCPDIAGINYARDPEDSRGYYLCVDGAPRQHMRCPQVSILIMGIPPKCLPFPHGMP
jgi:hypothetical protein